MPGLAPWDRSRAAKSEETKGRHPRGRRPFALWTGGDALPPAALPSGPAEVACPQPVEQDRHAEHDALDYQLEVRADVQPHQPLDDEPHQDPPADHADDPAPPPHHHQPPSPPPPTRQPLPP